MAYIRPMAKGQTPEAAKEAKRYIDQVLALQAAAKKVPLSILVWGQDPTRDTDIARKRSDIRLALENEGHNAMFSENITSRLDPALSEKSKEFIEAISADFTVILIEDSPGASAEVHDFCNHPKIAPWCLVAVPNKYRAGYSANGAIKDLEDAHNGVFWYDPADITDCHLLTKVVAKAEALRQMRIRSGGTP
jgi:hypothetical protein